MARESQEILLIRRYVKGKSSALVGLLKHVVEACLYASKPESCQTNSPLY